MTLWLRCFCNSLESVRTRKLKKKGLSENWESSEAGSAYYSPNWNSITEFLPVYSNFLFLFLGCDRLSAFAFFPRTSLIANWIMKVLPLRLTKLIYCWAWVCLFIPLTNLWSILTALWITLSDIRPRNLRRKRGNGCSWRFPNLMLRAYISPARQISFNVSCKITFGITTEST